MNTPNDDELEKARKFPWQWLVFILFGVIGYLFKEYQVKDLVGDDGCKERVATLLKVIPKKDSLIGYWQSKYLNEVESNMKYFKNLDSSNRQTLQEPAKALLKKIKE
ncbi:hypothetical protein GCM10023149_30780 [Mucilaginibacter gynuensis]|uniref:Uncharacterized protein n=1 Tax=Mucilaginibacter gynuensis TaxID=1302236 RepID=A0ABP8GNC4_9SPHI